MKMRYIKNLENEDIEELLIESKKEDLGMVNKLVNDFKSGKNKFDQKGEALIVYEADGKIVGVCGLNIDPTNDNRGRIRRLYVLPEYRKQGIGGELVKELIGYGFQHFKAISVNIGKLKISGFYESLGFKKVNEQGITHLLIRE